MILAVAVLCTAHAHSQMQILPKILETGVKAASKSELEIFVPTLEKGITDVVGAGMVTAGASNIANTYISIPTLEINAGQLTQVSTPATSIIPVSGVISHPSISVGMPSYAYGDVLVQVGNFHLFHNNQWYWVQPGAGAEMVSQPTKIIFPSQRIGSRDFAKYLEDHRITLDPNKTSRYDSSIAETEKFNTFIFKLRSRFFPKSFTPWK